MTKGDKPSIIYLKKAYMYLEKYMHGTRMDNDPEKEFLNFFFVNVVRPKHKLADFRNITDPR